jgi:hypothetical protein
MAGQGAATTGHARKTAMGGKIDKIKGPPMESNMLWTIGVILLILWLLGFIGGYAGGGLIHILLVIAIVVVLIQVIQGRRLS